MRWKKILQCRALAGKGLALMSSGRILEAPAALDQGAELFRTHDHLGTAMLDPDYAAARERSIARRFSTASRRPLRRHPRS